MARLPTLLAFSAFAILAEDREMPAHVADYQPPVSCIDIPVGPDQQIRANTKCQVWPKPNLSNACAVARIIVAGVLGRVHVIGLFIRKRLVLTFRDPHVCKGGGEAEYGVSRVMISLSNLAHCPQVPEDIKHVATERTVTGRRKRFWQEPDRLAVSVLCDNSQHARH